MNTPRHAYNSDQYSESDHEHLELIRILDSRHYFESARQAQAISDTQAQFHHQDGTPFDKLIAYANILDQDGDLSSALSSARTPFALFAKVWVVGYFVLGVVSAYGLLYGHFVNFFYLLIALLGWHSISLLLWLIRPKNANFSIIERQFNKLSQKLNAQDILTKSAYDTILTTSKAKHPWQMAGLTHKAWIFALLGNITGLLLLFLSKSYAFVWESTLLSQTHIAKLIEIIAIVPSWFGLDLSYPITQTDMGFAPDKLAILLMASIAIYGILPRLFALLYCQMQVKRRAFAIDGQLYFFENLFRTFSHTITDPNDYIADTPTPTAAKIQTGKKIVASLEHTPKDSFWYQFGTGTDVIEIGTLDDKIDFARLKQAVDEHRLSVYLGIGVHLLPDRGIIRKLELVSQIAQFGLAVELFSDNPPASRHEFYPQWQQVLTSLGIDEVRYH